MKRSLIIVGLIALSMSAIAQKAYKLKFKPKQGEKYDAVTTIKSSITQSMMGQKMEINTIYAIDMLYEISKVAENSAINMTYEKLAMDMNVMGQNIRMSTDESDNSKPGSKTLNAIKGSTISVSLSPQGKVLEVKGTDELAERLGGASEMEKETLKTFFNKESLKSTMEQSFNFFPDKPIKAGDAWEKAVTVSSPYKMISNNKYKLIKVENGLAYIDVSGSVTTDGPQSLESNGMEMQVNLTGDQQGRFVVDETSGTVKESEIIQNLKGKMEMMGQEIPMDIKNEINLKMVKK